MTECCITSSSVATSIESLPEGPRPVCTSSVTTTRAEVKRLRSPGADEAGFQLQQSHCSAPAHEVAQELDATLRLVATEVDPTRLMVLSCLHRARLPDRACTIDRTEQAIALALSPDAYCGALPRTFGYCGKDGAADRRRFESGQHARGPAGSDR